MPVIDQDTIQAFFEFGEKGATTAIQGRALEDLVCYLFSQIPGVTITRRNRVNTFASEEIDVALWNNCEAAGLFFLPNIILVECKNWSSPVSSVEVNWFDSKLRSRGLSFGILVAANGVTGSTSELTAAHAVIAAALREGRRLIVFTKQEISQFTDADQLVISIKEKLCDLAVMGTIF